MLLSASRADAQEVHQSHCQGPRLQHSFGTRDISRAEKKGPVWRTSLGIKGPLDKAGQQFGHIWSEGRGEGMRRGKEYG